MMWRASDGPNNKLSIIFYISCLLLAVACFYFSISEALFAWFAGDEFILYQTYNNTGWLFSCTKYYYLHTTVNRISADFVGCLMAKNATLFSTPYLGWVCSRLIVYIFIPISLSLFIREIFKIPFKYSLIIALFISAIVFFILSNTGWYMYGFDLAIYGTATITFLVLSALFPKSVENNHYFIAFCIFYAFNLMSHEGFLAVSGFYILLYGWYHYSFHNRLEKIKTSIPLMVKTVLSNRKLWILCIIYVICALLAILAPGVAMRQQTWPTSGTVFDGIAHIFLSVEELIYVLSNAYILIIIVFLVGMFSRFVSVDNYYSKNKLFLVFIFCAPFIYLIVLAFLTGITPTLWEAASKKLAFRWFEPWLSYWVSQPKLLSSGNFFISRVLFLYLSLFLDIFLMGYFAAGIFKKKLTGMYQQKRLATLGIFIVTIVVCFFHPDGAGSIRLFNTIFFKNDIDMTRYFPYINKERYTEHSLINTALTKKIFVRQKIADHEVDVTNIRVSHYFWKHRGQAIPTTVLGLAYDPVVSNSIMTTQIAWIDLTYAMYHIFKIKPCFTFSNAVNKNVYCHTSYGDKAATALSHKTLLPSLTIQFNKPEGVSVEKFSDNCIRLTDITTKGEHFLLSDNIHLLKGFYYFTLAGKSTQTPLFLYILTQKQNFILGWLNLQGGLGDWSQIKDNDIIKPIFSQVESSTGSEKLTFALYSAVDQDIQLRWQHGQLGTTIYHGNKSNISTLCKAEFSRIND